MMFDIPLPCTYEREISARRIVDEPDRYLPAIALLVRRSGVDRESCRFFGRAHWLHPKE